MTLRTLMQAGPAKAIELFGRLSETSNGALKTRERLFAELKAELELHVELEEQHLFPVLRMNGETKELIAGAIKDNKELRAQLSELEALPKNDESFLGKLGELQKAFRQHARDDKRNLLPAVERALSEEQVQTIVEKMEGTLAEVDQTQHERAEEKRAVARREREQGEQEEQQARQPADVAALTGEAAQETGRVTKRAIEAAGETIDRTAALASVAPRTGLFFWDMMLGMSGVNGVATRDRGVPRVGPRPAPQNEEVIPLAEEVLVVGKRTVTTGTTRIRRYVVESPVEQQVPLVRERVVVERRRPVTNKLNGEALTELTIEVVETDEVPVVAKSVQLREEIVIRTERAEHVETVRDTVRQDEVEIEHANSRRPARARA